MKTGGKKGSQETENRESKKEYSQCSSRIEKGKQFKGKGSSVGSLS